MQDPNLLLQADGLLKLDMLTNSEEGCVKCLMDTTPREAMVGTKRKSSTVPVNGRSRLRSLTEPSRDSAMRLIPS